MVKTQTGSLPIVRNVEDLRKRVSAWHADGLSVALVPTMGALHEGHMALVRKAVTSADRIVTSIFINPRQFASDEDLERYPSRELEDWDKLNAANVNLMYVPNSSIMYPDEFQTSVKVSGVSQGLCGDSRPDFFEGVATVVIKLLLQCCADIAIFGEKDYQQLVLVRRLVTDLDLPVEIVSVPTIRDWDGLALSSRNAYLTDRERQIAPILFHVLKDAAAAIAVGDEIQKCLSEAYQTLLKAGFSAVDYVEVRDANSLAPVLAYGRPARILCAAHLGRARLIDNVPIP